MLGRGFDAATLAEAIADEGVADGALADEHLADDWDAWAARWETEFQRLDGLEERRRKVASERARSDVLREAGRAQLEAASAAMRKMEDELEDVRRAQQKEQLREDAAQARKEVASAALQDSDDIVRQISENAARRRREADARMKKNREAARAAEWKKYHEGQYAPKTNAGKPPPGNAPNRGNSFHGRPDGGSGSRASSAGAGSAGSRASSVPRAASKPRPSTNFMSFEDFDAAWAAFEKQVAAGAKDLRLADVPWPTTLPTVSGVESKESLDVRKRKLRAALVRWHPDKWGKLMECIHEADRGQVVERVKEVTRRIITEKKMYGS